MAGQIMAAMQPPRINAPQDGEPRQNDPHHNTGHTGNALAENTTNAPNHTEADLEDGDPGDYARSQIAGLQTIGISVSQ
jgi:hypothetical protein